MRFVFAAILALAFQISASHAATFQLTGSKITRCTPNPNVEDICQSEIGRSFNGQIRIDESQITLGRRNSWHFSQPEWQAIDFDIGAIGANAENPVGDAFFNLKLDRKGQPVKWRLRVLEGSGEYLLAHNRLRLIFPGGELARGTPGQLRRVQIAHAPIPAAGWMLLSALGLLYTGRFFRPAISAPFAAT